MKKLFFGFALAVAVAGTVRIPSLAQANQFHPTTIPTTCINCDRGLASATFVNDPNHFHLVLNLSAEGCEGDEVGVAPAVALEPNYAGGLVKPAQLHTATIFAFDFKSNICSQGLAAFFVQVQGSDGGVYSLRCNGFPNGGTNQWLHENITRSELGMPPGVTMDTMYIGVINLARSPVIQAQVRNITVDGVAAVDITESAKSFCPNFP